MYQFSLDCQYVDDIILNFEKSFFRRGVSDKQQVGKVQNMVDMRNHPG